MKIIVGLGNPGDRYRLTRHNVGFLVIDEMVHRWNARGPDRKFQAEIFETQWNSEKVLLVKPQTFMNLTGESVQPILQFYKLTLADLIVIHDDLDIPPMEVRFKRSGGTGGHNGLKSIEEHFSGNSQYARMRVGIGKNPVMDTADYVLGKIPANEMQLLAEQWELIENALRLIMDGKIQEAMNRYHGKKE